MSKFKVGDKVKRVSGEFNDSKQGDIGTVSFVGSDDYINLHEFESLCSSGTYDSRNFELVIPAPKFKVGDKVKLTKILSSNAKYAGYSIGKIFEVEKEDLSSTHNVLVSYDGYKQNWLNREELELIQDNQPILFDDNVSISQIQENMWYRSMWYRSIGNFAKLDIEPFGVYPINNNKKTNIMSKITSYVKNLTLSADEKLLRKYGLHDDCGNTTYDGKEAIMENFYNSKENQDYLISIAKGLEEEANKNK